TNYFSWTLTNAPHAVPGMYYSAAAWGDFDNDGDLDLAVVGQGVSNVFYCRVYSNDHGALTNLVADLPGVTRGTVDWGDFDGDGDLDLLVTGTTNGFASGAIAKIYRNDGGTFVDIGASLTGVFTSAAAWGDFDNDGDLDLAIGGRQASFAFSTRIYRNDGGGTFVDIGATLPAISDGALAWADYDNDGLLDLLLTGSPDGSDGAGFTRIYRHTLNAGTHVFTDANAGLTGMLVSDVAWGDYDNNGTLDIAQSGRSLGNPTTRFWQNLSYPNTRPIAPINLNAIVKSNVVRLTWNSATDAETPSPALTYNLRVGTTPGGVEVMSPHSTLTNGFRHLVEMGNVQEGTNAWFRLTPGTYYWSVQSVDGAFAGSPFSPEQSFTVESCAPVINYVSTPTEGQFLFRFIGCAGVSYTVQRSDGLTSWSDVGAASETSPGTFEFLDPIAMTSSRFYRVKAP
ncbi:MAG: VCBS repeat-containing protein, partial [Verrucomicrobiota bacterium]